MGLPKEIKDEISKQLGLKITPEEWDQKCIEGELCAVLGCYTKPTSQCPTCKHWYCYEHVKIHVDRISDDEVKRMKLDKESLK